MEPHPVPQNIIDVEFKLFGSFTLKQFSKILVGGLIGVGIFFININPLIKLPLVFIAVIGGFGLAIIPNLGVWLTGFVKTLFVSPRYIWSKKSTIPEIFLPKSQEKNANSRKDAKAALSKKRFDIDELPLDAGDEGFVMEEEESDSTNEIFMNAYQNVYGNNIQNAEGNKFKTPITTSVNEKGESKSGFAAQFLSRAVQSFDINLIKPKEKILNTKEEYISELEDLRVKLEKAKGTPEEKEISNKMNRIYAEYKNKIGNPSSNPLNNNVEQVAAQQNGKIIVGIIVSKENQPINNAEVYLTHSFYNKTYKTLSNTEGRFSTHVPIPQGDYNIKITKTGKKFHNYKITISDEKSPAYKFREK